MIGWLKGLFAGANRSASASEDTPLSLRRFEAAKTHRLNEAHWGDVTGKSLNADLITDLKILRQRCEFEASRNPYLAGVMETHVTDIVGSSHPVLQIQIPGIEKLSDEAAAKAKEWIESAESLWRDWWSNPDINGQMSGPDLLRMGVRLCWTTGEFFWQKVTDKGARGPVKLRLNPIAARRVDSPLDGIGNPRIVMGVERNETGRPLRYFVQKGVDDASFASLSFDFEPIPAQDMIHFFEVEEPGQLRGVPWASTTLGTIADLRDYDHEVMDAARMAANYSIVLHTTHEDATYLEVNESADIERGQMVTAPPGWKPEQMRPEQPSTTYQSFRHERLRELGRPRNMPGMMVLLDSSGHNYSSARFDGQLYQRGNASTQSCLERRVLNGLVDDVLREGELAEFLGRRPEGVRYVWTWPVPPHVDPAKEATAEEKGLKSGTLSLSAAMGARGKDWESHLEQLRREKDRMAELNLTTEPQRTQSPSTDSALQGEIEDLKEEIAELSGE